MKSLTMGVITALATVINTTAGDLAPGQDRILLLAQNAPAARPGSNSATGLTPRSNSTPYPDAPTRDPWKIDPANHLIPKHPAQGPLAGKQFLVKRAKIEGNDLIISGESGGSPAELRLKGMQNPGSRVDFSIPGLVKSSVRYFVATTIVDHSGNNTRYQFLYTTEKGTQDLTPGTGLRLAFYAPENGSCRTAMQLALGDKRKEYVVGEFQTDLPADLAAEVKNIKPAFSRPNLTPQKQAK